MTNSKKFIETKEYKRFAEFCDACIEYKYIGICYGLPGVGKTLSSRYYSDWDFIDSQINYSLPKLLDRKINPKILTKKNIVLYCTSC